jgi:hypothetical protein
MRSAMEQGLATKQPPKGEDPLEYLRRKTYYPTYVPLARDPYTSD